MHPVASAVFANVYISCTKPRISVITTTVCHTLDIAYRSKCVVHAFNTQTITTNNRYQPLGISNGKLAQTHFLNRFYLYLLRLSISRVYVVSTHILDRRDIKKRKENFSLTIESYIIRFISLSIWFTLINLTKSHETYTRITDRASVYETTSLSSRSCCVTWSNSVRLLSSRVSQDTHNLCDKRQFVSESCL